MTTRLTARLADFASEARFHDLPAEVVQDAQRAVMDWLGNALAGALEAPAAMARAVLRRLGESSDATVFPAARSSAAGAAFANGVASHILELDDVHKGSTLHAAAPVIPAALAVAERVRASGHDFLLAVTLGYEVALRVGEAVNPSHYHFWHPTGTAATFGAAAAAGSLLKLSPAGMLDALGSAGTQAAGLWEFNADGSMSKHLHPGKAAMNGVLSADLAAAGFTGASRILEGDRGFFRAMSTGADASRITDGLGARWKVAENCYKLHSCCGHTHSAIDVALDYRSAMGWHGHEALDELQQVVIGTYGPGFEIVKASNPGTPYQAKFSLAYCVAAALLEGRVGLDQFTADRFDGSGVRHPAIATLLERVVVEVSADLTARYPAEWGTRVRFCSQSGATVERSAAFPVGNPENPVTTELLAEKLRSLLNPRFGAQASGAALRWVERLHACDDIAAATRDLVSAVAHRDAPQS